MKLLLLATGFALGYVFYRVITELVRYVIAERKATEKKEDLSNVIND